MARALLPEKNEATVPAETTDRNVSRGGGEQMGPTALLLVGKTPESPVLPMVRRVVDWSLIF